MSALYELDKKLNEAITTAINAVDNETGEIIDEDAVNTLESVIALRKDKLEACAIVIKELIADADAISAEAKTLKERERVKRKKAEWLRAYVRDSMQQAGDKKIETPRAVLSLRKSSAVVVDDLDSLPDEYKVEKLQVNADKKALTQVLKHGYDIAGAHMITRQNLIIK